MIKAGNDFELSGKSIWRLFEGDWYDTAMIYREWVCEHASWYPRAQLGSVGRLDTPAWMKKIPVWLRVVTQDNASIKDMVENVKKYKKFIGTSIGIHWYRWEQDSENTLGDYPYYFPPKKGFVEAVRNLQAGGCDAIYQCQTLGDEGKF